MTTGLITINSKTAETPPANFPGANKFYTTTSAQFAITSGTAADQCDLKYVRSLTLAASTPAVLDLTALTDSFGNPISFARVKSICVVNTSVTSGQVVRLGYTAATTNAWTGLVSNPGSIAIHPGTTANQGALLALAPGPLGWAVSTTSKLLQLDPGAYTIQVTVEICGCSS